VPGIDLHFPIKWALRDSSNRCTRRTDINCGIDGFAVLTNMKLPEAPNATVDMCPSTLTRADREEIESTGLGEASNSPIKFQGTNKGWIFPYPAGFGHDGKEPAGI
jgi:hypothetical protein